MVLSRSRLWVMLATDMSIWSDVKNEILVLLFTLMRSALRSLPMEAPILLTTSSAMSTSNPTHSFLSWK